jgi:hypothetical protein
MSRFTYTVKSASDVWNITHDLGKFVSTDIFVFRNGTELTKMLPKSVEYISDNEVRVTFTNPESGKAVICS